jgi:hypothetical protein
MKRIVSYNFIVLMIIVEESGRSVMSSMRPSGYEGETYYEYVYV